MPTVSVVMPVYNGEKYLREAIDSILSQTFTDFEFIIINDGSTDSTKEIILSYNDSRIVYLENQKNSGIVVTLNKGLDRAVGKYIARMDSDDISVKDRLEKQVAFLDKNKDVGLLGTGICIFGEGVKQEKRLFSKDHNLLKAELIFSSCLAHPTVMMRRCVLVNGNLHYNESFAGREDFALWWEFVKVSRAAAIPEVLLYYRIHNKQVTKNNDSRAEQNSFNLLKLRMKDIGADLTQGELKSIFMYCCNKCTSFEYEDCICFTDGLKKIITQNKKSGYFDTKALKTVFGSSIIRMYEDTAVTPDSKKRIFKYILRKHICPFEMTIKLFYHKLLKTI